MIQRMKLTAAATRTNAASVFPILRCFQIGVPERPSTALPWPGTIDAALPCLTVEEYAVAVGKFLEALPGSDAANVLVFEFSQILADERGQGRDLLVVDPHMARRAGAAIAALGASEAKSRVIPGKISHKGDSTV